MLNLACLFMVLMIVLVNDNILCVYIHQSLGQLVSDLHHPLLIGKSWLVYDYNACLLLVVIILMKN
jgi:hypothetical protein